MFFRDLWGLDCGNAPSVAGLALELTLDSVICHGMQEVRPALQPTSTVDLALMTLLRAERVTLQHLQTLLTALIQTNATEMWVQVRALCSLVARSHMALLFMCPGHVPEL